MQIILLEKVHNLGEIGKIVNVKDGYARNWLLPNKKAMRATKDNMRIVEERKVELEKLNAERRAHAEEVKAIIEGKHYTVVRQAGEDNRLFGSVSAKDISEAIINLTKTDVEPSMLVINTKFKETGIYPIDVELHPDVICKINLNIARSEEEASVAVAAAQTPAPERPAKTFKKSEKSEGEESKPAKKAKATKAEAANADAAPVEEKPKKKAAAKKKA